MGVARPTRGDARRGQSDRHGYLFHVGEVVGASSRAVGARPRLVPSSGPHRLAPRPTQTVQYFYYKLRYTNHQGTLPEFKIEPEHALELLMAANFLDT